MKHTFEYDPFQKQAMLEIDKGHSVIVSAPTGAGKTVIAEYVIDKCAQEKKGAIYTAPIKALSNQKYRDFVSRYGDENVGIITGDVSINPYAPIVIMTTEIFRNALFYDDEKLLSRAWVIFDEIHYLDDIERGTVWEESLMFFPGYMNMLCLSATIPNLGELTSWMEQVHHFPIKQIIEKERPVPLKHYFWCHKKIIKTLGDLDKYYHDIGAKTIQWKGVKEEIGTLINHIKENDHFPCIYFVFARRRCEELAEHGSGYDFLTKQEKEQITELWDKLIDKYNLQEDRKARSIEFFIKRGIAYHHAGMLPTLKEVIEQLFASKLIKLIFTTETFALGINMPARSVIFDELRKFYGFDFDVMRTRDYYQMAGRAGRRGMDVCGYVYSRVNCSRIPFRDIKKIITGEPEKVMSQFNTSYATLMCLFNEFKEELFDVYLSSFHCHQAGKDSKHRAMRQLKEKISLLKEFGYISNNELTSKGHFASQMF